MMEIGETLALLPIPLLLTTPPPMNVPLALASLALVAAVTTATSAEEVPCPPEAPCGVEVYVADHGPSWVFRRSTYTHDPYTGARVAQYMRTPPVEPLDDERMVTSRYRRSRTNLRGIDGSVDTYYEVQAWGNGRGGIDAEWERFHDAWKESILSGGYYNQRPGYVAPWSYGGPGYGYAYPDYGFPGHGYGGSYYPPHSNSGYGHHHGDGRPRGGHRHGGHDGDEEDED